MTPPLDPNLYPATYQTPIMKGGLKIMGFMTVVVLGVLARSHVTGREAPIWLFGFVALILIFPVLAAINVTFAKIILYTDRIERLTWFGAKSLLRSDVFKLERDRRSFSGGFILFSKKSPFDRMQLPGGIQTDAAWNAWMAVAADGDEMPTNQAMLRGCGIALAIMALLLSGGFLAAALLMHLDVNRRAVEQPVTATVAEVRHEPRAGVYFARLIFDRKQSDGSTVHCDVPNVRVVGPPKAIGAMIKVAPRASTCWEPDVICEACTAPSDGFALDMLIVGAISGSICFLLFWAVSRMKNKPDSGTMSPGEPSNG